MKGQPVVRIRSLVHPEGVVGHQAANDQEEAEEDDEADKCWERQQLLSFHGLNLVTLFRHVTHRPADVGIRHPIGEVNPLPGFIGEIVAGGQQR